MSGLLPRFLLKEAIVAKPGFNRWLVPPASIAIHLCIGSVYAWSIFNPALIRELGVVTSASGDWSLQSVMQIFSVAIFCLGVAAAIAGKWLEEVGPRCVGVFAACLWGSGFLVGSVGVFTHQLWLLYLGYGVLGGCGLGLGYVSPVSTLIRWFPDRRGMATGMAIMGFGGGAIIGGLSMESLMGLYFQAPEFLGALKDVALTTKDGIRYALVEGVEREVVVATAADVARLPGNLQEGVYLVGTGFTGAATTFLTLGIVYFIVMMIASFSYRVPAEGWLPKGFDPVLAASKKKKMITTKHVHIDTALKTPQFWQLWIMLCFNVTAGIGVIGVAKTMMTDIFGSTLPGIVHDTSVLGVTFAGFYVIMISVFNMGGRFLWASGSDLIGRKNTYHCFFALGALLYLSIPFTAQAVNASPSVMWLVMFYAATMIIFTMYGGGFATIPAYLADIFGTKYVGGIHGRLLTAWSTAGVAGPFLIGWLRESSKESALRDLAALADPAKFQAAFGAGKDQLDKLIEANTVTVANLMEIVPAGTVDPTPTLYNTTMFVMVGLLVIAFFANLFLRPVADRHTMKEEAATPAPQPAE